MKLECPHVNVLSKVDLIEKYGQVPQYHNYIGQLIVKYGQLSFEPEFYTELIDLPRLLSKMHHSANRFRFSRRDEASSPQASLPTTHPSQTCV